MTNTKRYTCRKVRDLLPLHVGGDLESRHVGPVDEHLHECLSCFREFRELATLRGRLGVVGETPVPSGVLDGFTEEVMARIALDEPGPAAELPGPARRAIPWAGLRAAAAVALVALVGWQLLPTAADDPSPASLDVDGGWDVSDVATTTMAGATPIGNWAELLGDPPAMDGDDTGVAPVPYRTRNTVPVGEHAADELIPSAQPMIWRLHTPAPSGPKLRPLPGRVLRERER